MGERLSSVAGWIIQSLIFGLFMSTYWFYWPPSNLLESSMAFTICFVSAWFGKKILEAWLRGRS